MKILIVILLTILNSAFISSCSPTGNAPEKVVIVKKSDIVRAHLGVSGMTCVGCEVTLEENISGIEGVVSVRASHTKNEAVIEFDATKTDIQTIAKTIEESGYEPFNN